MPTGGSTTLEALTHLSLMGSPCLARLIILLGRVSLCHRPLHRLLVARGADNQDMFVDCVRPEEGDP
jgi:hypothetical protein